MKSNESNIDRIIRAVLGVVLVWLGFGGALSGVAAVVLDIVGIVLLATAAIGFCPLYRMINFSTLK